MNLTIRIPRVLNAHRTKVEYLSTLHILYCFPLLHHILHRAQSMLSHALTVTCITCSNLKVRLFLTWPNNRQQTRKQFHDAVRASEWKTTNDKKTWGWYLAKNPKVLGGFKLPPWDIEKCAYLRWLTRASLELVFSLCHSPIWRDFPPLFSFLNNSVELIIYST